MTNLLNSETSSQKTEDLGKWKTRQNTRENTTQKQVKDTVEAFKSGLTDQDMRGTGCMIKQMGRVDSFMQMATFTLGNGEMTKRMDMESICILMEQHMSEIGRMISRTGMERKHGLMVLFMKGTIQTGLNMEKVCFSGQMGQLIMVSSEIITLRAKEFISGLINENMKEIG